MKLYKEAGLRDLVDLYHSGATAKAVSEATSFDKNTQFSSSSLGGFVSF